MNFAEVVAYRLSVRDYTQDPVEEDTIRRILEMARQAPSACNNQPWHFYAVRDEATRHRLFPNERYQWAANAPVVIVACSVPSQSWVRQYDGKNHADVDVAIAMEHIMLAATAEGLGTCWICSFDPAIVRAALALPEEHVPVAITPLGIPNTTAEPRPRKGFDEIVSWR